MRRPESTCMKLWARVAVPRPPRQPPVYPGSGGSCERAPEFHYRPLAVEPGHLKRRLFDIPVDRIEDPTLAHLFCQKQDELDRKITLLTDIGSRRFLYGSLQVFGFSAGVALLVSFLLSIATAGALWVQLERLMAQVEAGNFRAVDFDNFDQFF